MRTLFKGATIVDGTGRDAYRGDLLVEGGTIQAIGCLEGVQGEHTYECRGLVLAPGFIDMHAHSEVFVLNDPPMGAKIGQGITTEFGGNCGIGAYPSIADDPLATEVLGSSPRQYWPTFGAYTEAWRRSGSGVNMGFFQAHGPLRNRALGEGASRMATADEVKRMEDLLEESLEGGVWGLSTGLYYEPCYSASTEELVALARLVARYDRLLAVHLRCEGNTVVESLEEMIHIARESGVRLEVSHLKAIGRENQHLAPQLLTLIDRANSEGLEVTFDQYPYLWGSTSLFSLLPPQFLAYERTELQRRLKDTAQRAAMRVLMEEGEGWDSIARLAGFDGITILSLPSHPHLEGRSIAEIAVAQGTDPYDALFDILSTAEGSAVMGDVTQSEENLARIMSHPGMCFGSDALYGGSRPHPRSFNAALHLIGRYVNETHTLTLEEAVTRLSGRSATRLGLADRGFVREGYKADLVLFDPARLNGDLALTKGSTSPLDLVMVNGEVALEGGKLTGMTSGELLVPLTDCSG